MAKYFVEDTSLTAVADAIRTKGGTTEQLSFPDGFVFAVEGIQAGGGGVDGTAIVRSIFDKSITEYIDSEITFFPNESFRNCTKLATLQTPKVTNIGNMTFRGCSSLKVANFPNLAVANSKQNVFDGCSALTSAIFPSLTTLFDASNFFRSCISLTEVYMPKLTTVGAYVFMGCTALEELDFPAFNGDIYNAFCSGCTSLKKVSFGTYVNMLRTECFYGCVNLEAVIIRGNKLSVLANVNNFAGSGIENGTGYIYVPASMVDTYKSATNWSTYASQIRAIEDYPEICGGASA